MISQFIFREQITIDSVIKSYDTELAQDEKEYILTLLNALTSNAEK